MKINRNAVICDPKGRPFNEGMKLWHEPKEGEDAEDGSDKLTLGFILYVALNQGTLDEKKFKVVLERHALIGKLYNNLDHDELDVTPREATLLQDLLVQMTSKGLGVWVAGVAGAMLEEKQAAD